MRKVIILFIFIVTAFFNSTYAKKSLRNKSKKKSKSRHVVQQKKKSKGSHHTQETMTTNTTDGSTDLGVGDIVTSLISFQLNAAYNHWYFKPIDIKNQDSETSDWSNVSTEENYNITALNLYHINAKLQLPFIDLEAGYQSNRGAFVTENQVASDALNLVLDFKSLPILENISFEFKTFDFTQGKVILKDRMSQQIIDEADFNLKYTFAELRYKLDQKKLFKYVFVRYSDYSIPRNVYLQQSIGEQGAKSEDRKLVYYQISTKLIQVKHNFVVAGINMDISNKIKVNGQTIKKKFNNNLLINSRVALGGGHYQLSSLATKEDLSETSTLIAVLIGFELDYKFDLGEYVRLGIKDVIDFQAFTTYGLPADLETQAKEQGIDTKDLSLSFGTLDLFNTAYVYLDIGPKRH